MVPVQLCEKESELESVQLEFAAMKQNNIELDGELSELQQQIAQLQPIKNELKMSLASFDRLEAGNTQLSASIQELTQQNILLNSRINVMPVLWGISAVEPWINVLILLRR